MRKVLLDGLDPELRCNFERMGWLPLLNISHPSLATLIREFYSNLSVHSYDANILVRSWVRGVGYTITPSVVVVALRVSVVQHPVYPYDESPPLDDIMSYVTRSYIQWGSDPQITTAELTRFIISSLGLLVILFGLSLICTPFFWSVVHFFMPLLLMLLLAFLIFLFVP